MAKGDNQAPVIIRKRKKGHGHEHHGGAWKVAYADFVTAMMAFFLLLWLLSSTSEEQRTGLADYFSPSFSVSSGGGSDGLLGGRTMTSEGFAVADNAPISVTMTIPSEPTTADLEEDPLDDDAAAQGGGGSDIDAEASYQQSAAREQDAFEEAAEALRQAIEAVPDLAALSSQLIIDQTPEGLRIQLVDEQESAMFPLGSAVPNDNTRRLFGLVSAAIANLPNKIAVSGHTDATPFRDGRGYGNWELSSDRALASRRALVEQGLSAERIAYVAGKADQEPLFAEQPGDARNRRISITLLRETRQAPERPQQRPSAASQARSQTQNAGTPPTTSPYGRDLPSLLNN